MAHGFGTPLLVPVIHSFFLLSVPLMFANLSLPFSKARLLYKPISASKLLVHTSFQWTFPSLFLVGYPPYMVLPPPFHFESEFMTQLNSSQTSHPFFSSSSHTFQALLTLPSASSAAWHIAHLPVFAAGGACGSLRSVAFRLFSHSLLSLSQVCKSWHYHSFYHSAPFSTLSLAFSSHLCSPGIIPPTAPLLPTSSYSVLLCLVLSSIIMF